jgi:hypothetical protein
MSFTRRTSDRAFWTFEKAPICKYKLTVARLFAAPEDVVGAPGLGPVAVDLEDTSGCPCTVLGTVLGAEPGVIARISTGPVPGRTIPKRSAAA